MATNGLWKFNSQRRLFTLCVDNFGVKYKTMDNFDHFLINAFKDNCVISINLAGKTNLWFIFTMELQDRIFRCVNSYVHVRTYVSRSEQKI